MEIIKHGTFSNVITCHCGCKFRYDKEDIIQAYNPYESSTSVVKNNTYVICPECNARIYIGINLRLNYGEPTSTRNNKK